MTGQMPILRGAWRKRNPDRFQLSIRLRTEIEWPQRHIRQYKVSMECFAITMETFTGRRRRRDSSSAHQTDRSANSVSHTSKLICKLKIMQTKCEQQKKHVDSKCGRRSACKRPHDARADSTREPQRHR